MAADSLQIALVVGIILMALISVASLAWSFYLAQKLHDRPVPKTFEVHVEGTKLFSDADLAEAESLAKVELQKSVQAAAGELQQSVSASARRIAAHVNDSADATIGQELEKYRVTLGELQIQTIEQFGQLRKDIDDQRVKLLTQLELDVAREQEKRMDHFNERINDVVASYLAECLGNQVDLGAQAPYILQTLQKNKEEIKREVLS